MHILVNLWMIQSMTYIIYYLFQYFFLLFLEKEQRGKQQSNSNCGSSHPMNKAIQLSKYAAPASHKKQQLIPPGSLGTLTKATYDRLKQQPQHRRMGPTTSALVRPAPLFSRPPPGAALRVMPPKKRVKLDEDDDINNKSDDSIKSKSNIFLDNPYMKGKDKVGVILLVSVGLLLILFIHYRIYNEYHKKYC